MIRKLFLFALLLPPLTAHAQNRAQSIDPGRIEEVRLDDEGHATLRFRTENVGRLRADVFSSPDETGPISVTFRDTGAAASQGATAGLRSPVWEPGRYEADVQASNPGSAIVQMRISVDIPLDEFEPNNARDAATRVNLPFEGVVRLSRDDPDWFRVDPQAGGVLGVHLHTASAFEGPRISIYDNDGTLLMQSADAFWGHRGMRYVRTTGRRLYIEVTDSNDFNEGDANAFKTLEIVHYRPEGTPASTRSLVTLSLEGEDPSTFQLDLVGEAIGVETVAANEAGSVARELDTAIRGRQVNWSIVLATILGILALGGGGFFLWLRTRAGKKASRDEAAPIAED